MIQELFTGNTGLIGGGENTISKQPNNTPSPSLLSSTSPASSASASLNSENLKCPRCDSPNTKFCYYNNYNLTQPRHFCKTCRRYWTKGGALRNVPIGGGCRKNKNSSITNTSATKSSAAKLKASLPFEIIGKAGFIGGFEQELIPSNSPFLFSSPQTHPLLSLLRGNQTSTGSFGCMYKDERPVFGCAELDGKSHEINSYNQLPSNLLKNNHHPELLPMQNGTIIGEVQSTGLQELYQRLKASTSRSNFENYAPLIFGNTSSSSSIILESAPVTGGTEVGFWNTTIPTWSDLPTAINAAYH